MPEPDIEDELIGKYSEILQTVYDEQEAGTWTFTGILASFLRELDRERAKLDVKVKPEAYNPPHLSYPPGVRGFDVNSDSKFGPRGDAL